MRLHPSVIEKIIQIYTNHGGYTDDRRLREHLNRIDLTPYERKSTQAQDIILVLTEDYLTQLQKKS